MAINGMSGPGASNAAGNPGGNNGMNPINRANMATHANRPYIDTQQSPQGGTVRKIYTGHDDQWGQPIYHTYYNGVLVSGDRKTYANTPYKGNAQLLTPRGTK